MNNKEKVRIFWKITNHLNKKFCKNKLDIKEIKIVPKLVCTYNGKKIVPKVICTDNGKMVRRKNIISVGRWEIQIKTIKIVGGKLVEKGGRDFHDQIDVFVHELAHVWQDTFYREHYLRKLKNLHKQKKLNYSSRYEVRHDKKFLEVEKKFLKEVNNHLDFRSKK